MGGGFMNWNVKEGAKNLKKGYHIRYNKDEAGLNLALYNDDKLVVLSGFGSYISNPSSAMSAYYPQYKHNNESMRVSFNSLRNTIGTMNPPSITIKSDYSGLKITIPRKEWVEVDYELE
jgi:hypothetical protein